MKRSSSAGIKPKFVSPSVDVTPVLLSAGALEPSPSSSAGDMSPEFSLQRRAMSELSLRTQHQVRRTSTSGSIQRLRF